MEASAPTVPRPDRFRSSNSPVLWRLLVVGLVGVLVLAACGGSDDDDGGVAAPSDGESAVDENDGEPTPGGELTFVMGGDVVSLDPHRLTELVSGQVVSQVFDYLFVLNADGEPEPSLVADYTVEDTTWTFELRDDVTFHDGTPLDAEAVKANFDRILDPDEGLPARVAISAVESVEVAGPYTVTMTTTEPFGPMLAALTHYSVAIVSPTALESGDLTQDAVGSGPFRFVSWSPGDQLVIERNDDYWGRPAYVDRVVFRPVTEGGARVAAVQTGEADIVANIPPTDIERLSGDSEVDVRVEPFNRLMTAHINVTKGPLTDVRVRQALNYAVDREGIVAAIYPGVADAATAPLASPVFGYEEQALYSYDPDRARELLEEAGHGDGLSLSMISPAGRYLGDQEMAEAIQAQFADVGIDLSLEFLEWSTFLDVLREEPETSTYELALLGFGPATNDADWQLYSRYHSSAFAPLSNNRSYYASDEVDDLLEQGRSTMDQDERRAIYGELLPIIYEDAPEMFLVEIRQVWGLNANRVRGTEFLPIELLYLADVWLEQ